MGASFKAAAQALIHDGFVYHTSVLKRTPPAKRYLICAKYTKSGCRARAVQYLDEPVECLRVTHGHNHPPDLLAEERSSFLYDLKATVSASKVPLRECFNSVIKLYPNLEGEMTWPSLRTTMRRWKAQANQ